VAVGVDVTCVGDGRGWEVSAGVTVGTGASVVAVAVVAGIKVAVAAGVPGVEGSVPAVGVKVGVRVRVGVGVSCGDWNSPPVAARSVRHNAAISKIDTAIQGASLSAALASRPSSLPILVFLVGRVIESIHIVRAAARIIADLPTFCQFELPHDSELILGDAV
jgi:hypothetical protein